jgi:hypothetical protein
MPSQFIDPCLPTISRIVPTGTQWAYEIKHLPLVTTTCRHG